MKRVIFVWKSYEIFTSTFFDQLNTWSILIGPLSASHITFAALVPFEKKLNLNSIYQNWRFINRQAIKALIYVFRKQNQNKFLRYIYMKKSNSIILPMPRIQELLCRRQFLRNNSRTWFFELLEAADNDSIEMSTLKCLFLNKNISLSKTRYQILSTKILSKMRYLYSEWNKKRSFT